MPHSVERHQRCPSIRLTYWKREREEVTNGVRSAWVMTRWESEYSTVCVTMKRYIRNWYIVASGVRQNKKTRKRSYGERLDLFIQIYCCFFAVHCCSECTSFSLSVCVCIFWLGSLTFTHVVNVCRCVYMCVGVAYLSVGLCCSFCRPHRFALTVPIH